MSEVRGWLGLIACGGLGGAVLAGYKFPLDPSCTGRCGLDTFGRIQSDIGDVPLAMIFFVIGVLGFIWYARPR